MHRIKARLKRAGGGAFGTADASDALYDHLGRTNRLDEVGKIVMRFGCRLAIVESSGKGLSSAGSIAPLPSVAEILLRRRQQTFNDYDADWLDEELAITDGPLAERKSRGDCSLIDLRASIEIRFKQAAAMRASAERDQALIDRHPQWEIDPTRTVADIVDEMDEPK